MQKNELSNYNATRAKAQINSGKATDPNNVAPELLKALPYNITHKITNIFKQMYALGTTHPRHWKCTPYHGILKHQHAKNLKDLKWIAKISHTENNGTADAGRTL